MQCYVICYQWFKQRLWLNASKPSISQQPQFKEDTVEPDVPAREFNLKAYATITWHKWSGQPGRLRIKVITREDKILICEWRHWSVVTLTVGLGQCWRWTFWISHAYKHIIRILCWYFNVMKISTSDKALFSDFWLMWSTSSLASSILHLSRGFQCSPTLNRQPYEGRLPSLTHHFYDWHPGSHCGWTCNQLTSKVDGGITESRLRWSIPS